MDTTFFGRAGWLTLHLFSLAIVVQSRSQALAHGVATAFILNMLYYHA